MLQRKLTAKGAFASLFVEIDMEIADLPGDNPSFVGEINKSVLYPNPPKRR